ncbi:MAG: hypothetical protein WCI94_20225 [Rhodospirillales bacterium]
MNPDMPLLCGAGRLGSTPTRDHADKSSNDPRGNARGGGSPLPRGTGGGLGAAASVGEVPGPRAYWRVPAGVLGREGGAVGRVAENAESEDVESMTGIMHCDG